MGQDDKNASVGKLIDANLRRVYDSVLNEEVPDRFADLLRRLETEGAAGTEDAAKVVPSRKPGDE
jgi:hypothetical protein